MAHVPRCLGWDQEQGIGIPIADIIGRYWFLFMSIGPKALMVSILVAIAAHMEESALLKAREAMQGGDLIACLAAHAELKKQRKLLEFQSWLLSRICCHLAIQNMVRA